MINIKNNTDMQKPNKLYSVHFEVNDRGEITAIHAGKIPGEYVRALINKANAEIESGALLGESAHPHDALLADVNYILNGGTLPGDNGMHE